MAAVKPWIARIGVALAQMKSMLENTPQIFSGTSTSWMDLSASSTLGHFTNSTAAEGPFRKNWSRLQKNCYSTFCLQTKAIERLTVPGNFHVALFDRRVSCIRLIGNALDTPNSQRSDIEGTWNCPPSFSLVRSVPSGDCGFTRAGQDTPGSTR